MIASKRKIFEILVRCFILGNQEWIVNELIARFNYDVTREPHLFANFWLFGSGKCAIFKSCFSLSFI